MIGNHGVFMELNFLPLVNSKFEIPVFRRRSENNKSKSQGSFGFRLKDVLSGDYERFDVLWEESEGFELYHADSSENHDLTKLYILSLMESAAKKNNIECYSSKKNFYREIRFVTQKYKEGQREVRLSPYYLSVNKQFGFLVQHHFKMNADQKFNRDVQKLSLSLDSRFQQNRDYYLDVYKIIKGFFKNSLPHLEKLADNVMLATNMVELLEDRLSTKQYTVGKGQQNSSQYAGIKKNGPYQNVDGHVKYLFVFSEPLRNLAREVYSALDGKLYSGLFSGLNEMFHLPFGKENVDHYLISDYSEENLSNVASRAIEMREGGAYKVCVLAFFADTMSEEHNHAVYSHLKLEAIKGGFFAQVVNQETMGKKEQLKWSIANIALQIFGKLGGIPWLLKPSHPKCLIFGIGSAHEFDADGAIKKYTAYSVCIDTQGRFNKIQPLASSADESTYLDLLKRELIGVLQDGASRDVEECVVHLPYKIEWNEMRSIEEAVKSAETDHPLGIKIVKINTHNRFFGFSSHVTKVPYESTFVELSSKDYLIWTEGLQYGKELVNKRISEPIHVEFLYGDIRDYDEAKTYLQDIINLTGANWRGFNSKAQPISIYYSKLIADFMRRFGAYESVSDFSVMSQESFNPWFL